MRARSRLAPPILAALAVLTSAAPAPAFSQFGRQDGTAPDREGVIAAPLPPLQGPATPGAAAQAETPQEPPAASEPSGTSQQPATGGSPPTEETAPGAAQPDATPPADGPAPPATEDEEGTDPQASQQATPDVPAGPPPDVEYNDSGLPAPVRELRAKMIELARSGEIERLRPYIQPGEDGTVLSFGGIEGDPIDFLKTASGDGEGVEVLAILLEVLEAGHVRNEPGTENEIFVWPYFASVAVEKLTKQQKVELFELVTAGDYQEMVAFGAYNFYRVGITPDGKLQFFVAGD